MVGFRVPGWTEMSWDLCTWRMGSQDEVCAVTNYGEKNRTSLVTPSKWAEMYGWHQWGQGPHATYASPGNRWVEDVSFFPRSWDMWVLWVGKLSSYIWVFPKIGLPPKHPKMIIFSRKTHGCWVPPFLETSIYTELYGAILKVPISKGNSWYPWEGILAVVPQILFHIALYNNYIIHI